MTGRDWDEAVFVKAAELRPGDEVQGYGTIADVYPGFPGLVRVSSTEAAAHFDAWPSEASVPVWRRPKKWVRTIVIEYDRPPGTNLVASTGEYGNVVSDTTREADR